MLREFTKYDYYGFAGAEKFTDGTQPLIAEYGPVIVIVDKNCIAIMVYEGEEPNDYLIPSEDKNYKLDIVNSFLAEIKGKTRAQIIRYCENELGLK